MVEAGSMTVDGVFDLIALDAADRAGPR